MFGTHRRVRLYAHPLIIPILHPYFQHMCVKLLLAAEPLPKIAKPPPTRKHEFVEVIISDIKTDQSSAYLCLDATAITNHWQ